MDFNTRGIGTLGALLKNLFKTTGPDQLAQESLGSPWHLHKSSLLAFLVRSHRHLGVGEKGEALESAKLGLGFPTRRDEIQRFGYKSRRVFRVTSRKTDERSFAEVATMDSGCGCGQVKRGSTT